MKLTQAECEAKKQMSCTSCRGYTQRKCPRSKEYRTWLNTNNMSAPVGMYANQGKSRTPQK
ncbi:hypothetical protein LCGC14_2757450 [marine sediment metagenome]|uniref:Uncharacterized protein n=1 Tax=marine sediment metagenome TaxID=412755 RepID=A0A0F9B8K2_9ZZZZ